MNNQEVEISNFYKNIRTYWESLSRSPHGESSCMLNFGYWPSPTNNLYQAQKNFIAEISHLLPWEQKLAKGLEIGCGIGGISINLLEGKKDIMLTALDISKEQLSIGINNAKLHAVDDLISFQHGDAMNLPFENSVFDFSVCIESTFHYQDKKSFFAENFRILRPGGYAVVADITCEDVAQIRYRHGNFFESRQTYIDLAVKAGFTIEVIKDIGVNVFKPLHEYIIYFNKQQRIPSGKYWSVVLNNYEQLSECGLMNYPIFLLKKSE